MISFNFTQVLLAFLDESAVRLASLTANWLRVGFCQGNFNGDNCLVWKAERRNWKDKGQT